ncbi:MAG: pentapeptide repeat-containing protein, partial [Terriglobia bacterium]
ADLRGLDFSKADFHRAKFNDANLSGANLSSAILTKAEFCGTNLSGANLSGADLPEGGLTRASLAGADLSSAALIDAKLSGANLTRAKLTGAILNQANLTRANLTSARLTGVDLREATLAEAEFEDCDMTDSMFCGTSFSGAQICRVRSIEKIEHWGPSVPDWNTLLSQEKPLPEVFLRGIGLDDDSVKYLRTRWSEPVVSHSCFIAYAPADVVLASRLHDGLQDAGIRCWTWKCKNELGWRISPVIYHDIGKHGKLVVIASQASLTNGELHCAIRDARYYELKSRPGKPVIFPVAVDDCWQTWKPEMVVDNYWKFCTAELKEIFAERQVVDARGWEEDTAVFKTLLSKLI